MPINNSMSHRIRCYTLFDITATGVTSRSKPEDNVPYSEWLKNRNTQHNFDTILQIISLRSQPEVVKNPEKIKITQSESKLFGTSYELTNMCCWTFEFEIQHASVFHNNNNDLGALYIDCSQVPMVNSDSNNFNVSGFLDTSSELKNIHFEII